MTWRAICDACPWTPLRSHERVRLRGHDSTSSLPTPQQIRFAARQNVFRGAACCAVLEPIPPRTVCQDHGRVGGGAGLTGHSTNASLRDSRKPHALDIALLARAIDLIGRG